jgi:hypothetical protein
MELEYSELRGFLCALPRYACMCVCVCLRVLVVILVGW